MKVCLGEEADLLDGYNLFCLFAWIGTHNKHAFTLPKERIHIKDADALGREQSDSLSGLTWRVVNAQGKDIGQLHVDAVLAKEQISLCGLIAEDTIDAIVLGVSDGGGYDLDVGLTQKIENADECSALVLNEYGKLFDGHLCAYRRLSLPCLR